MQHQHQPHQQLPTFGTALMTSLVAIPTFIRWFIASLCRNPPTDCTVVKDTCELINVLKFTTVDLPFTFACKDATRFVSLIRQADFMGLWFELAIICALVLFSFDRFQRQINPFTYLASLIDSYIFIRPQVQPLTPPVLLVQPGAQVGQSTQQSSTFSTPQKKSQSSIGNMQASSLHAECVILAKRKQLLQDSINKMSTTIASRCLGRQKSSESLDEQPQRRKKMRNRKFTESD